MDTAFLSATKLVRALRSKKIGALELLDLYAKRIERYDRVLNALPVLDLDIARKRAKAFDRKGAKLGPLAGLPMTVKESFNLAGHPTTWGLAEHRTTPVASNALAVERFLRAGGNVFGKSNVPTLLADWVGHAAHRPPLPLLSTHTATLGYDKLKETNGCPSFQSTLILFP